MKNKLTLKWGTLKAWGFSGSDGGKRLLKEYHEIGASESVMLQNDTPRQKEIICELIDLCDDGTVYLDWDGKYVSNAEAKNYIMNYNEK
jgi:hypothetical protein